MIDYSGKTMSKHTPGEWVPPFRTVSQCIGSQYAQGWNDCREAMIKSDQAPRLLEALEQIAVNDDGPAGYIARAAIEATKESGHE